MSIVYLDQNKWIELARAIKRPDAHTDLQPLVSKIRAAVGAGSLVLPLTSTNIYETHKVNDPVRRRDLAYVQAVLSQGLVVRGRHKRIVTELTRVLADCCKSAPPLHMHRWFLSNVFFEAFCEWRDDRLGFQISENFVDFVRTKPAGLLYDYIAKLPEDDRKNAVKTLQMALSGCAYRWKIAGPNMRAKPSRCGARSIAPS